MLTPNEQIFQHIRDLEGRQDALEDRITELSMQKSYLEEQVQKTNTLIPILEVLANEWRVADEFYGGAYARELNIILADYKEQP